MPPEEMAQHFSKSETYSVVCLKKDNKVVGFISLNDNELDVPVDCDHVFHSQRVSFETTTEAIQRMVQFVFDEMCADRIVTHNAAAGVSDGGTQL